MTRRALRLSAALILAAGAITLAGCSGDVDGPGTFDSGCVPPLACGPSYPVPYYPWAASPYMGYLHDPAHVIITTTGPRTTVIYRPYSPPVRTGWAPAPPRSGPAGSAAKPAAPAAKPAAPAAPRPAAPRVPITRK